MTLQPPTGDDFDDRQDDGEKQKRHEHSMYDACLEVTPIIFGQSPLIPETPPLSANAPCPETPLVSVDVSTAETLLNSADVAVLRTPPTISHSRPSRLAARRHTVLQNGGARHRVSTRSDSISNSATASGAAVSEGNDEESCAASSVVRGASGGANRRPYRRGVGIGKTPKNSKGITNQSSRVVDSSRACDSDESSSGTTSVPIGGNRQSSVTLEVARAAASRHPPVDGVERITYWLSLEEWTKLQGAVATWLLFRQHEHSSWNIDWVEISLKVDLPKRQCEFIWWNCDIAVHYRATLGYIVIEWDKNVQPHAIPDTLMHRSRAAQFIEAVQDRVCKLMRSMDSSTKSKGSRRKDSVQKSADAAAKRAARNKDATAGGASARGVPKKLTKRRKIPEHPSISKISEPISYSRNEDTSMDNPDTAGTAGVPVLTQPNGSINPSFPLPALPPMRYQSYPVVAGVANGPANYYHMNPYVGGGMYGSSAYGYNSQQHLLNPHQHHVPMPQTAADRQQALAAIIAMQQQQPSTAAAIAASILRQQVITDSGNLQSYQAALNQIEQLRLQQQHQQNVLLSIADNNSIHLTNSGSHTAPYPTRTQPLHDRSNNATPRTPTTTEPSVINVPNTLMYQPLYPMPDYHVPAGLTVHQQYNHSTSTHSLLPVFPQNWPTPIVPNMQFMHNTGNGYANNVGSLTPHLLLQPSLSVNLGHTAAQPQPVRPSPFAYRQRPPPSSKNGPA